MGFRNGAYATVWEVKPVSAKVTEVKLSTSRKNREGNYETDFSGYCRFVGANAAVAASKLNTKDRIKLGDVDVTQVYDKEKERTYTNFVVFGFEDANNNGGSAKPAPSKSDPDPIDDGERNIPF